MRKAGTSQSRRSVLAAGGATLATAVAGCNGILGGDGSGNGSGNGSGTGTTTDPTPTPELPNVEQRIVERDRAAIAHVYTTVEGRVTWPDLRTVSTAPGPVLGDWQSGEVRLLLRQDETFVLEDSEDRFTGDYQVRNDRLLLGIDTSEPERYRYEVDEESSPPTLSLYQNDELVGEFERTERISGSDDPVEQARATEVVREEESPPDANSQKLSSGGNGSGFVVSPDGYLVTNAHVIQAHQESATLLYRRIANLTLQGIRQGLEEGGLEVTDVERDQIEQVLLEKLLAFYREEASLGEVTKRVRALNGRADPDDDLGVRSWQASIEAVGEVVRTVDGEQSWGRDVAILQVPQTDLQTVTLGSSEGLSTGADVYVIG